MHSALIIEDHENSSEALTKLLEHRNFEVQIRSNMTEGLETFNQRKEDGMPFDIVVADLCLPDSPADATLATLVSLAPTPVRAITGISDPEIIKMAKEMGVNLILKGTSAEGIVESILYAILDRQSSLTVAKEIVENREKSREIPLIHPKGMIAHIFMTLPKWAQIAGAVGVIIGTLSSMAGGATLIYKAVYVRGATSEQVASESTTILNQIKTIGATSAANSGKIRDLEDSKRDLTNKIDTLADKVDENKKDTNQRLDTILQAVLAKH